MQRFKKGDWVIVNHEDFMDKRNNWSIQEKPYRVDRCSAYDLWIRDERGLLIHTVSDKFNHYKKHVLKEILDKTNG